MTRIAGTVPHGPKPGGPYSTSVRIGSFVAIAGQCGYLPDRSLADGLAAQTRLTMENLRDALEAGGATLDDVISVNAYLVDTEDFAGFNEVYAEFFADPAPARTTIYCGLRPGVLVEVSAIAVTVDE
ncbi:MAG TPA: RidA family protein [Amycolatopsis sp.]|jgi:2-iminobutanoate/2-iminopropanoate deaminase|nr:RidA family protein [Amycolatopsis sp.]